MQKKRKQSGEFTLPEPPMFNSSMVERFKRRIAGLSTTSYAIYVIVCLLITGSISSLMLTVLRIVLLDCM